MVEDITGNKYNRLTVIGRNGNAKNGAATWDCVCDCGNTIIVAGSKLKSDHTKSCGCLSREGASKRFTDYNTTHNLRFTPEYDVWRSMKKRCTLENQPNYKDYGGRGICVCDRWAESFENFYSDMGARPTEDHSIDRIDNNGDYTPDNCRWATREQQENNKS